MTKFLTTLFFTAVLAVAQQPVTRIVICTDAGASDTYACSPTNALGAYSTGLLVHLYPNTANTGAATVNISALGAKTIKKTQGAITTDLETGDIKAGQYVQLIYDGTNFQLMSTFSDAQVLRWTLDGGGSALTAATGPALYVPTACTINTAIIDADQSGSVSITVEKATYTTGTPSYSTISSGFALSSARGLKDTTLSGWTVAVAADSLVRVSVTGTPTSITKATVILRCN